MASAGQGPRPAQVPTSSGPNASRPLTGGAQAMPQGMGPRGPPRGAPSGGVRPSNAGQQTAMAGYKFNSQIRNQPPVQMAPQVI